MLLAALRLSVRRPVFVLVGAFLIAAPVLFGLTRLELKTDGRALLPDAAPELSVDAELRATFEVEEPIVVLLETDDPEGVYNRATLERVRDLSSRLEELDGRGTVSSLATEASPRLAARELRFLPFLEPFPETREDFERVRSEVEAIEIYEGTLVSFDAAATALYVGVPEGADRTGLVRAVRAVVDDFETSLNGERLYVLGAPVAEVLLGAHLMRDLGLPRWLTGDVEGAWRGLVWIVIVIVFAVFWVVFRSPFAALPPLIEVGTCTAMVFGAMGWLGVPVYLTTAILPVILVALGIADEIHVFERFRQLVASAGENDDARVLVERALLDKAPSVIKTSVTTALGFLSFTLSPIAAVRAFGLFAGIGILLCMLWTLTVVPALLVLLGPGRLFGRARDGSVALASGSGALPTRWVRAALNKSGAVLALSFLVTVAAGWAATRIVVQDGWISGFSAASEFRRATESFEERFFGTHRLLVCVEADGTVHSGTFGPDDVSHAGVFVAPDTADDPQDLVGQRLCLSPSVPSEREGDLTEWWAVIEFAERSGDHILLQTLGSRGGPEMMRRYWGGGAMDYSIVPQAMKRVDVLDQLARLEQNLMQRTQEGGTVGGVLGPARYLATTNFIHEQMTPGSRSVPPDTAVVERLWRNYGAIRGDVRLRQAVDASYSRALVDVYLKDANYKETAALLASLREYERDELQEHGLTLSFSGDVATSQTLIEAVVTTQIRAVLVSLVGIAILVSLLMRSLAWGVLAVVPAALSVLINLAGMASLGIPLGVATSMFAAMTLGIGVDYAIHFLEWTRREGQRGVEGALLEAARVSGPALVVDALAVGLGFGVLVLSQVPANARLGGLLLASVVGCLVITLWVLPPLVRRVGIPGAGGPR